MKKMVSVIMPTYNCGEFIAESIESVINQTILDWELLVIDDCSTDHTREVVQRYVEKNPAVYYECLKENSGPAVARNIGIKKAIGKYIAFLDSDDVWDKDKLEKQISFMEQNRILFSCTGYRQMDSDGNRLNKVIIPPKRINYQKCILLSNPIGNLTAVYNQEALGKIEVPLIQKRNDFALWLKILKKTDYCYGMSNVLGTYRVGRQGSVSSNKLNQMKYHWMLYHNIEKHSIPRSVFEVLCWAFVKGTGIGINRKSEE